MDAVYIEAIWVSIYLVYFVNKLNIDFFFGTNLYKYTYGRNSLQPACFNTFEFRLSYVLADWYGRALLKSTADPAQNSRISQNLLSQLFYAFLQGFLVFCSNNCAGYSEEKFFHV